MLTAPMPARGMGMVASIGTQGTPRSSAIAPRRPPAVMTTSRAPVAAASDAASTVSSVLPENDTASTSVPSSMKFGSP